MGASTPGTLADLVGEPEGILLFALLADLDFLDFFDLVDSAVVLPAFPIVGAGDSKKVGEVASPPEALGDSGTVGEAEFFFLDFPDFFAPPFSAFPAGVGEAENVGEDAVSPPETLGDSATVGEAEFFILFFFDFFAPSLFAFPAPAAGLVFLCSLSLCLSSSPFLGRSALANTPICICCTSSCARRVSSAVANGPPRRWRRVPIDEYFISR